MCHRFSHNIGYLDNEWLEVDYLFYKTITVILKKTPAFAQTTDCEQKIKNNLTTQRKIILKFYYLRHATKH